MIPGVDTAIPAPPSAHTLVVLCLIVVALALFALERIRLESAALLVLISLLLVAAVLSAFLNNTPIVVVLLAPLVSIAQQNGVSPAKLLLPFGLVTIIGGMATTIGTSTNLLVVTLSDDIAGIAFGMFDFIGYVVIAGTVGLIYLWLLAPRMTPAREREQRPEPRLLAASTALHAQTFSTERMIQLHAGPDEYYFFEDDEKKVVDYKKDRMVRICVDESLHTVPMRVTHDGDKTIVHPGDCIRIEGKEIVLTPDTELDEE